MISYDLKCHPQGHVFEGWFGSADSFQEQLRRGLIACPHCGSVEVERQLSIPNVGANSNQERAVAKPSTDDVIAAAPVMTAPPVLPPALREVLARVAEAQAETLKQSEWVGDKFADEVRAQHYGEAEERLVHGEASAKQAQDLAEEGIAIMPILFPVAPPDKRN